MQTHDFLPLQYSPEIFGLSVIDTRRAELVRQKDWDKADPLPWFAGALRDISDEKLHWFGTAGILDGKPVSISGPAFAIPAPSSASAKMHYVAFNTYATDWQLTGRSSSTVGCDLVYCPHYGGGRYWIDIYDLQSGDKRATITGHYSEMDYTPLTENQTWVDERYFLMPLGPDLRRFVFCDFGQPQK